MDESFFAEIATEVQAYWLGFITADGGISRTDRTNTLRVGLQLRDEAHLVRMNADLDSDRPLLYRRRPLAVVASFDSFRLIDDLQRLGVGPRKSRIVQPWSGPAHLASHYWRGVFDGDGSVSYSAAYHNWALSLAGNQFVVQAFADWARRVCGSLAKPRLDKGATWTWTVGGGPKPRRLAMALYENATVSLDRKQERADQLIATVFGRR